MLLQFQLKAFLVIEQSLKLKINLSTVLYTVKF